VYAPVCVGIERVLSAAKSFKNAEVDAFAACHQTAGVAP
jgi:hypothetical protein